MRLIPTKVHGYLDYSVGAMLIAAPWLFDFTQGGAETCVPVILGSAAILYSLVTGYERGVTPGIPMGTHLTPDLLNGLLLAGSPWIFGFADIRYVPHLAMSILEFSASLLTIREPAYSPGHKTHHGRTLHAQ